MADDKLTEYVKAKSEFENARGEIKQTAAAISDIVNALKSSPERVRPSEAAIPIVSETKHNFKTGDWPTGELINELLTKMHTAYYEAHNIFISLPEPQRKNVVPLDSSSGTGLKNLFK